MKKVLKAFLIIILAAILAFLFMVGFYLPKYILSDASVRPGELGGDEMTIMSTNVRYIAYDDFFKRTWFYRAELICNDIESVKPDIIGFQEATFVHYNYLKKVMVGYESEIAYRDNFVLSEGCPIFWREDRFEKIDSGSFWLSETPEVMSRDWGSEHYRICVYVILRDRTTDREFAIFNTHLDNVSDEARINGIGVVLDKIAEFGDIPTFLMGDMNAIETSKTMQSAYEHFDDACLVSPISEDTPTFHGFGDKDREKRIDYILVGKGDAELYEYRVLNNEYGGVYSSDHRSIYIKAKLN